MIRRLAIAALLALLPVVAHGQTTNTIEWDYAEPVATVNTYALSVRVDGVARVEPVTCSAMAAPANTLCRITIPAMTPTSHSITILASAGGVSSEYTVTGINPSKAPKNPNGNPRIVITTTITISS
jgi:hypothetical protein